MYLIHAYKRSFIKEIEPKEMQRNLSETLDGLFNRLVTLRLECKSSGEIVPGVLIGLFTLSFRNENRSDRRRNYYLSCSISACIIWVLSRVNPWNTGHLAGWKTWMGDIEE